jgi:C4-dicarboxylate-binding protein DctP
MRLTVLIGMLVVLAVNAHAAAPILIRFSHVTSEATPKGHGAALFKKLVEQRLAGKVRVEIYPRALKFNDDQALLALLFGDVELAAPSFSKFRSFSRQIQVFDLPFLFSDVDAVNRFQRSEAGIKLLDSMLSHGIKGLAYWDNGMRVMSANRPLRTPRDFKRLRFRIEPSAVMQAQYRALGVATVPMPFKQVREALKMGLVTGQENAWSNIHSQGFHDFQKYFTETRHTFLGYMLVTNVDFWNNLPAGIRVELEKIIQEVTANVNKNAHDKAKTDRQRVIDSKQAEVITLTDTELDEWRTLLTPIWKQFESQIGTEIMEQAMQANQAR